MERRFCWSCGTTIPERAVLCPDPDCRRDDAPVISVEPPRFNIPFCGQKTPQEIKADKKVKMRACCSCDKEWMCDVDTWIHGKCPHCGATGADSNHKKEGGKELLFLSPLSQVDPKIFPDLYKKIEEKMTPKESLPNNFKNFY